jgi:hypothetical protein
LRSDLIKRLFEVEKWGNHMNDGGNNYMRQISEKAVKKQRNCARQLFSIKMYKNVIKWRFPMDLNKRLNSIAKSPKLSNAVKITVKYREI